MGKNRLQEFKCYPCNKTLRDYKALNSHNDSKHSKMPGKQCCHCHICGTKCPSDTRRVYHILKYHTADKQTIPQSEDNLPESKTEGTGK